MWIKNLVGDVDNAALPLLVMSSHVVRQCRLAARDLEKELVTVTVTHMMMIMKNLR